MKNKLIELKEIIEHLEVATEDVAEKERAHNIVLELIEKYQEEE